MAVNQLLSIPYRMHAPTPKATMKEMLKFIGMLGAPGCDVKGRRSKFPQNSRRGIAPSERSDFGAGPLSGGHLSLTNLLCTEFRS